MAASLVPVVRGMCTLFNGDQSIVVSFNCLRFYQPTLSCRDVFLRLRFVFLL